MNGIHQIVTRSHGAYTHDDVFMLEAGEVKQWQLQYYEEDCLAERMAQQQKLEYERQKST